MNCTDCKNAGKQVCTVCCAYQGGPDRWEPKPETNADAIRDMTDEELANFLALQQIGVVTAIYKAFDEPVPDAMTGAREEWLDWLRQAAEEGE